MELERGGSRGGKVDAFSLRCDEDDPRILPWRRAARNTIVEIRESVRVRVKTRRGQGA